MDNPQNHRNPRFYLIFFFSILKVSLLSNYSWAFSPVDNYLISCGSVFGSNVDNQVFVGDSSKSGSAFLSATRSVSLRNKNPPLGSSSLYNNARIFREPSKYEFEIKKNGTHMIRLHFFPFSSSKYNLSDAQFHVSVREFVLLSDFSSQDRSPVIKEFLIWVDTGKLEILFTPSRKSSIAFLNAIEVISAPEDLIADTALFVSSEKVQSIGGLINEALETVYRINVGGPKVTPFNDSLWRTWIPDDNFLKFQVSSKTVYTTGRIKYQKGGASREVAPDNVYNTARVMNAENVSIPGLNITWVFPVSFGYRYLVRMHFCDIASVSANLLYFNVYVNGYLAYEDLDLSQLTDQLLSTPYYVDFVVDGQISGTLNISIGPLNMSTPGTINAILNGVEIMKMNNSMGSLSGALPVGCVLQAWHGGNNSFLVPLVVILSLLITASIVMKRRRTDMKDFVAWSPLPLDVSERNVKYRG